jgi:branched-chain amino acid transport system permease protein
MQLTIIATAILVGITLAFVMKQSSLGKAIRAVSESRTLAEVTGISPGTVTLVAFAVGSFLVSLIAILTAYETGVSPDTGFKALSIAVIVVVIGGRSSYIGAGIGGLLLGLAEHFGIWLTSDDWKEPIAYVVLVIFLVFRPQGLLGKTIEEGDT